MFVLYDTAVKIRKYEVSMLYMKEKHEMIVCERKKIGLRGYKKGNMVKKWCCEVVAQKENL